MAVGIVEKFPFRGVEYQLKYTRCNKPRCKSCPHGPYWYGLISIGSGKQTLRYVGKILKGPVAQAYKDSKQLMPGEFE